MTRYIIGFLLSIGLIIVVIILIFRGSSAPASQPLNLDSYANTDAAVQLTVDSPVAASSTHHDIILNIDNTQATITVTQGYEGKTDTANAYPMNVNAYATFLHSLELNGFADGNNNPSLSDDRGHCALGDRYIYEVINGGGNNLERYWSTSCATGTFEGNGPVIRQLFDAQFPDYNSLTSNVTL
ncbi:MAG: hypothetical protein ACREF5_01330 [Candidatus Saccharimonadales bacterium]